MAKTLITLSFTTSYNMLTIHILIHIETLCSEEDVSKDIVTYTHRLITWN